MLANTAQPSIRLSAPDWAQVHHSVSSSRARVGPHYQSMSRLTIGIVALTLAITATNIGKILSLYRSRRPSPHQMISHLTAGQLQAIQEYKACENAFQCTAYCRDKGFNDRVCKTITIDESTSIDGSQLINRRACLCSESSESPCALIMANCVKHARHLLCQIAS